MSALANEVRDRLKDAGLEHYRVDNHKPGRHRLYSLMMNGTKLSPYLPGEKFRQYIDGFFQGFKAASSKKFRVLSPDGFDTQHGAEYGTIGEAQAALTAFVKSYERQGYYSTRGYRIPLDSIAEHCKIIPA